jgi:hypothetical protein
MHPKSDLKIKTLSLIIFFIFIFSIFNGVGSDIGKKTRTQPINALEDMESGFGVKADDRFGWNVSYAGNLNGDSYDDLIVGAPGNNSNGLDSGAVYVFYGNASPKTLGVDPGNADIVLTGQTPGDNFGWDVACAGDWNDDGHDDIIVGAPDYGNGKGKAFVFYGGTLANVTALNANVTLNGTKYGEAFGSSVEGAGDIDNDGFDDVIVGAPKGDRAYIFYGQADHQTIFTDLWDMDTDKITPETDFTSGLNATGNTMGYLGEDDGWDWHLTSTGPYGGDTSAVEYNADPNRDNNLSDSKVDNNEHLIISIGDDYGNGNHGDSPESAAYGVEFEITSEQDAILSSGGNAYISFDYYFDDSGWGTYQGLDWDEEIWIKCRFGQLTMTYIGYDLDGSDNNADASVEVYWDNDPNDISWQTFSFDVTNLITGVGSHYLDLGGKVRTWANLGASAEDGIFHFDNILLKVTNQNRSTILGGPAGTAFGTSVAGLNNFNGDITGYDDVAVGAPFSVRGHTYVFFGDGNLPNYIAVANSDVKLNGIKDGELYGWSIAGAGDINNDNFGDLLVGAPGGDRAYVHYGKPTFTVPDTVYPNLWDDNESSPNIVSFDFPGDQVNSTGNSFGLGPTPSADDDGWDWANGTYGQNLKGGSSIAHHYDPENVSENFTFDGSNRLEVQVGPSHAGNDGSNQELIDSAAWGVQFDLTPALSSAVTNGGEAYVSIVWAAQDTEISGQGTEEASYVKARLGTPTGYNYLGSNLGGDPEPEILYRETTVDRTNPWGPASGWYLGRVSNLITQPGWHYLDFGVKFDASSGTQGVREGIRAYFNSVLIIIFPRIQQDITINGTQGEKFGFSVSGAGRVNTDNFDDIIIGAPDNTNANGDKSGASYVFAGGAALSSALNASLDAIHINYGENSHDEFGRAVSKAGNVDGGVYSELFVGAPYNDSTPSKPDTGKAYVLSVLKRPKITLNYPIGGEVLNGEIDINATVTDSDNNIDLTGVRFYYSTDRSTWTLIGNDPTPELGKFYTRSWDTTTVNDNVYYIKVDVADLDLNDRWDTSDGFIVDNQYPPTAEIHNPHQDEVIFGQYQINTTGFDSPMDTIGGGIDENLGMQFYLSSDNATWELLGNDNSTPTDGQYQFELDTTSLVDGRYWIKVNVSDIDNTIVGDLVGFEIDNPSRVPILELLYPTNQTELSGVIDLQASAFDMDNDINSSGVTFYYSNDEVNWVYINNDSNPYNNIIYAVSWDTGTVNDGWYWVKTFVNDTTGLSATNISNKLKIQNTYRNPPTVKVTYPNGGEEVQLNVVLEADAYDFDDNLNIDEGVKFSYSSDKINWILIGYEKNPDKDDQNHYTLTWNTLKVPDGRYWLNASAKDTSLLTGWDHSDEPFFLHNVQLNPPFLNVVTPNGGEMLSGNIALNAHAGDLEDNIDLNGVSFYYTADKKNWTFIDNALKPASPDPVSPKMYSYELDWDTTKVEDGKYWLKAVATDTDGFSGEDISDGPFFIHNNQNNSPNVKVIYPNGGEVLKGKTILHGTGLDLENNIDASGLKFYYSNDAKITWHLIGNQSNGVPQLENTMENLFEFSWDTNSVPDGFYWLKVEAVDLTNLTGFDLSDDSFVIHNDQFNPPVVKITSPQNNETVKLRIELEADVFDMEDNVNEVRFYYSSDQIDWTLINTTLSPTEPGGDIYRVLWNTEDVFDGEYWLKVIARDNSSLTGEAYSGVIFVENGLKEPVEEESEDGFDDAIWMLMILIIVIIIIACLAAIVLNRKRKSKKMDETLASLTPTLTPDSITAAEPPTEFDAKATLAEISGSTRPKKLASSKKAALPSAAKRPQALLPSYQPPETNKAGEDFESKISTWKSQGYDVTRLEELIDTDIESFWDVLPVFINNINKLDELKPRFNALDTTGFESEASSLRSKFKNPDQAIEVEHELQMLESKIDQRHKLADEEAAEDAKTKAEEEAGEFDGFLPTLPSDHESESDDPGEIGTLPEDEPSDTGSDMDESEETENGDQDQ